MITLPIDKYDLIVMDPPWDVPFKTPYNTMKISELALLNIKKLCSKGGATVFIWTPNSHLEEALGLARVWGLRYKQLITWCKNYGLGRPPYTATEHCIMATYGNPKRPHMELGGDRIFNHFSTFDKPKHSKKPEAFFDMINAIPALKDGKKLEMFARNYREGWTSWGDQL